MLLDSEKHKKRPKINNFFGIGPSNSKDKSRIRVQHTTNQTISSNYEDNPP
jgi:hypothetical protein